MWVYTRKSQLYAERYAEDSKTGVQEPKAQRHGEKPR